MFLTEILYLSPFTLFVILGNCGGVQPKDSPKKEVHEHVDTHENSLVEKLLNSSTIRSLELALTVFSFIAGIWGTLSLGMAALK